MAGKTLSQIGSTPSSTALTEHRAWIKGRAAMLLAHYWREGDDPSLIGALGKDWADVLEDLPQDLIQRACVRYLREEPRRRPSPAAIYQLAAGMLPNQTGALAGMPWGWEVER